MSSKDVLRAIAREDFLRADPAADTTHSFAWLPSEEFEQLPPARKDGYLRDLAVHLNAIDQPSASQETSDNEQRRIDRERVLSEARLTRAVAREICEEARVNCWIAATQCAYARFLIEESRKHREPQNVATGEKNPVMPSVPTTSR